MKENMKKEKEKIENELKDLRKSFFTKDEMEYFIEEVFAQSKKYKMCRSFLYYEPELRLEVAKQYIQNVDAGKYNDKQMEYVETAIAFCLAPLEGEELELALTPKTNEFEKQNDDERIK